MWKLAVFMKFLAHVSKRHAELFLESHFAFENRRGSSHTVPRKQRGENAVAGRGGKGDAFPMREFARAGLSHRRASYTGNVHCVPGICRVKFHQLRGRQRSRECPVSDMIPTARTNARRVA